MSTFCVARRRCAENGLFCSLYADRASHYWHTPEAGGGVDKDNPTQVGRALAHAWHRVARTPARPSWLLPSTLERTSSAPKDRVVAGNNTVRYKNRTLQIPADRHRHHYVKAQVRVHEYPDGHLAVFPADPRVSGALPRRRRNHRRRQAPGRVTRFDATEPIPPQQKRSIHMVHKAVNSVCYRQLGRNGLGVDRHLPQLLPRRNSVPLRRCPLPSRCSQTSSDVAT